MFWRRKPTKEVLKNRLQVVLAYDRAEISPGKVEELRNDIMAVIQKHFPNNKNLPNLEVERRGEVVVLSADIPIN